MQTNTIQNMLVEPTAHSILDSGDFYGRSYQRNAKRDFEKEPQAVYETGWGATVNTYQHLQATLFEDEICKQFNALPCDRWDHYGYSQDQKDWLEERGFEFVSNTWNTYNWDNCFDQVLQGERLELDGEEYVLLQVHGGCDVRGGYTDAKLFYVEEPDYFLDDSCSFDLERKVAEAAGYPHHEGEHNYIHLDLRDGYRFEIYDPNVEDEVEPPEGFFDNLPEMKLEGVQRAIEH